MKTKTAPKMSESDLQCAAVSALRLQYPDLLIFHVPNGRARSPRTGAMLKREGTLAGTPDLLILGPQGHVLALELKVKGGSLSEAQKAWRDRATALGAPYHVCTTVESTLEHTRRWLDSLD